MSVCPFLLKPSGKDYLWGGQRINTEFEKKIDMNPLAETWECSTHPDGPSIVASGNMKGEKLSDVLIEHPEYLGLRHKGESELSILIKFIDAKSNLSVQVHPDDDYAIKYENGQLGKTEMWYVLDATRDAKLVYGLRKDCAESEIRDAIQNGSLTKYLQTVSVKRDDVFFIDAGTIHAIGEGCLIAEIQESSNLTYRLFDYNRADKNGKKRTLHVDKAIKVAKLTSSCEPRQPMRVLKYRPGLASELLSRCKYFEVFRVLVNTERRQTVRYQSDEMGFRVLLCIGGCGSIMFDSEILQFYKGDCVFIPALSVPMKIHGQATFLDVRG